MTSFEDEWVRFALDAIEPRLAPLMAGLSRADMDDILRCTRLARQAMRHLDTQLRRIAPSSSLEEEDDESQQPSSQESSSYQSYGSRRTSASSSDGGNCTDATEEKPHHHH